MTGPADVPAAILAQLRPVCLGLPDAYEEPAWVGIRWRIRTRTFAHVLTVDPDRPSAYVRASAAAGPECVMTFRAVGADLAALTNAGHPFFKPDWHPEVVGMALGGDGSGVDWTEVAELLTESYCILAPRRLADRVRATTG